jgi:uncharacterized glyoxalase superfamily protein PhnB
MTDGIEAVYLETHNWGKSARFFQKLGYTVEFETDHNSGQLRNGDGPFLFIVEVPATREPGISLVLAVADEDAVQLDDVEVVTPFETKHWGAREMTIRDPDGRTWQLHVKAAK